MKNKTLIILTILLIFTGLHGKEFGFKMGAGTDSTYQYGVSYLLDYSGFEMVVNHNKIDLENVSISFNVITKNNLFRNVYLNMYAGLTGSFVYDIDGSDRFITGFNTGLELSIKISEIVYIYSNFTYNGNAKPILNNGSRLNIDTYKLVIGVNFKRKIK